MVGFEARGRLDDLGRDLEHVGAVHGMAQGAAERHAAAQPNDRDALRVRVQQERQVREEALRQHVARVRRVDLAVDREHPRACRAADGHRRGGALLVVLERAGRERGLNVGHAQIRRVFVRAAREERLVPARRVPRDDDAGRAGCGKDEDARTRDAAGRRDQDRDERRHGDNSDDGGAQTEPRNQRKTRGERTGNRAHGVRRVQDRQVLRQRLARPRRETNRDRKQRAQDDRHRQQQRGRHQPLTPEHGSKRQTRLRRDRLGHPDRQPADPPKRDSRGDAKGRHEEGEPRVRVPDAGAEPSAQPRAQPKAGNERGQHQPERVRRRTDDEREDARPDHLAHERREPGHGERDGGDGARIDAGRSRASRLGGRHFRGGALKFAGAAGGLAGRLRGRTDF